MCEVSDCDYIYTFSLTCKKKKNMYEQYSRKLYLVLLRDNSNNPHITRGQMVI